MNVMVLGQGAREHALAWALGGSPSVKKVYVAPGNPGSSLVAENLNLDPLDFQKILDSCRDFSVDLVVVGPEDPLAEGVSDYLTENGISVFGPKRQGANLESSKSYAKSFMKRHNIPHPLFWTYENLEDALKHIDVHDGPYVMKKDGLAKGKGVFITHSKEEAKEIAREIVSQGTLVVEEFLEGRELSAMFFTDSKDFFLLPFSQDHKRIFDGDKGPMTGGMGAYSPVPWADDDLKDTIIKDVVIPSVKGLFEDGIDYRGCLYAGLMITPEGPKVLEYNVRLGDPETQCLLPLLDTDFGSLMKSCADGRLKGFLEGGGVKVKDESCVTVVMSSSGYPDSYETGFQITGIPSAENIFGVQVFHAGTGYKEGALVTAGGRVLSVTALGKDLRDALSNAYTGTRKVNFQGAFFRKDIGKEALS